MSGSQEENQTNACPTTEDHLKYMPGVDLEWANTFIEYAQKYQHFEKSMEIFWTSPRVVRIAILRPESIIRLMRKVHEIQNPTREEKYQTVFEEDLWYVDFKAWNSPIEKTLHISTLESAIKYYEQGMTPMQAMQKMHACADDGQEKDEIPFGGTLLIEPLVVTALFAIGLYFIASFFFG